MHPWVWGRMRLYGVQGTQSVRADDEPETRPIIGEKGSTLRLTTTERRLKPRTSPESQPRLGFTGASKNSAHRVFSRAHTHACTPTHTARSCWPRAVTVPDCHASVRGLTEVWVRSVLREGPCGELAPIAPAYHRPPSGGGAGTPFREKTRWAEFFRGAGEAEARLTFGRSARL